MENEVDAIASTEETISIKPKFARVGEDSRSGRKKLRALKEKESSAREFQNRQRKLMSKNLNIKKGSFRSKNIEFQKEKNKIAEKKKY